MSPHQLRLHRKILSGIMLCAFLSSFWGGTWNVQAQKAGGVDLKAQVGFDGYCKENEWLPVHVEVENTGADLNAEVQVSYKKGSGGNSTTSMEIDLPATSRKEFLLYIYFPGGYNRELNVTLLANRKALKRINLAVNCISSENMIFGVLADNPSMFDVLNDIKPIKGFVRVAQLETAHLPDREQAWASLDALIVSNVDTGTLTPEQKQALKSWIAGGGKLLITGGINWQGTVAGLKDLMPVDLTTTSQVASLSQLQTYVKSQTPLDSEAILAKGQVREGSQVLVDQDGIPLIVQRPMGFGMVYFFAADPALQPLNSWDGMKDVYEHLLGMKVQLPAWARASWYDYRANQALATIPELGLPSVLYICGLLGLYILIIGPLNYFVLRRMKRRELAWVTIPALVIIFTCLAYGTGFSYRGATPILNRLAVAQAWDGVDQAQVHALVGIYSPVRAKYDLEASHGFVFQPLQNSEMNLQAGNNWTSVQQGSSMIMPDVPLEIGAMKAIMLEGSLPALEISHDLVITLDKSSPLLTGNITNKSQYTLKDAFVVTSGNWTRLGTLVPGETKPVRVWLGTSADGPTFYGLDSMSILGVDYSGVETNEIAARRSAFLDTVLSGDYGFNQGNWGIYLMGWVDQIEIPAGLKDRSFEKIDTMLYIDRLSPAIKTKPGELMLPTSLFLWESSTAASSPYLTREIQADGYVLQFQPAVPITFRTIKSMELYLSNNGFPHSLSASAWDYELKKWVHIPLTGEHTSIPEASRYVGPDGEVKIKIETDRSGTDQATASNISLVVEP